MTLLHEINEIAFPSFDLAMESPLIWLATSLESTLTNSDSTYIFSVILNPANSASYSASLLVLSKLSLQAYVYFVLVGLIRTKPDPDLMVLDTPYV
ncbi:hypothetical protein Tco_1466258 [Tanacetum coccineum]